MKNTTPTPKYPNKRKPFFTALKAVLKLLKPKLHLIDHNDGKAEPGIFVSNHCGTSGPFMVESYLPYSHHPWGAYQMNGNIVSRFKYLYHVLYRQKLHMRRIPSLLLALIACPLSKGYYKGMGLISTYPDIRLKKTMRRSMEFLHDNVSIVIYPENSDEGYKEVLTELHGGFAMLSRAYERKYHVDVPVYPMYFNKQTSTMVVDTPIYIGDLRKQGMSQADICEYFKNRINDLRPLTMQTTK